MEREFAPVCSTWSFLPSSLLAWAALPLLGNRLQDELLGLSPERQWWNTQWWNYTAPWMVHGTLMNGKSPSERKYSKAWERKSINIKQVERHREISNILKKKWHWQPIETVERCETTDCVDHFFCRNQTYFLWIKIYVRYHYEYIY